jgi:hypothetical protein
VPILRVAAKEVKLSTVRYGGMANTLRFLRLMWDAWRIGRTELVSRMADR